jgi:hypothetical protein
MTNNNDKSNRSGGATDGFIVSYQVLLLHFSCDMLGSLRVRPRLPVLGCRTDVGF